MSFAQMHYTISDDKRTDLRDRLAQEWRQQHPGLTEPIIIEERAQLYSDLLRLYVIWSEWSGMGQRERSRIIMDSYQLAKPEHPENITSVSVAMGLTAEEAQRMGIEYAPLDNAA